MANRVLICKECGGIGWHYVTCDLHPDRIAEEAEAAPMMGTDEKLEDVIRRDRRMAMGETEHIWWVPEYEFDEEDFPCYEYALLLLHYGPQQPDGKWDCVEVERITGPDDWREAERICYILNDRLSPPQPEQVEDIMDEAQYDD